MRLALLTSSLFMFGACGDNQHHFADARMTDSGLPDTHDATDASIPSDTRVWALGDIFFAGQSKVAAFTDGMALPFGNGTVTPVVLPAASSVLSSTAGYLPPFDVTRDGSKTAFIADATVAARFDIYAADNVGGSSTMLVQGTSNVTIVSVAISPDGSKVAYAADSAAIPGGYDMYVVSTSGGAPTLVSPARPMGAANPGTLAVTSVGTWSSDSRYLAFVGDLTQDGYFQGYCADTNTSNVAIALVAVSDIPGSSLTKGVFNFAFDSTDQLYFTGRLSMTSPDIQLYRSAPDGTGRTDLTTLVAPRNDASEPDVGAFGISEDGTKLVFASDTPTANNYDVFAVTVGDALATNISHFSVDWVPQGGIQLQVSPDNKNVAALGRLTSVNRTEPFLIALDGTDEHRLLSVATSCPGCFSPNATQIAWTRTSDGLYLLGDVTTNNNAKLYRLNPSQTDQLPTIAVNPPASVEVAGFAISAAP